MASKPYRPNRQQTSTGAALCIGGNTSTITTQALDSNYVYETSGDATGLTFCLDENMTLTNFFFVCSAIAGTGSGDGNINWELREGFGGANYKPGSLVTSGSGTIAVSGLAADTWAKVTLGTPLSLTAGVFYTLILGDADGDGSNYITIVQSIRNAGHARSSPTAIQTADGWATAGTSASYAASFVLKFSSGYVLAGTPLRATTGVTNNTLKRGLKLTIPAGLPALQWLGLNISSVYGGWTASVIRGASALPDAAAYWSQNLQASLDYSNSQYIPFCVGFTTPPILYSGETWFLLLTPNSSSTLPSKSTAYAGMDADLRKCLSGYDDLTVSFVQEIAGPAWSEDADATLGNSFFFLNPAPQPTIAA